MRITTIHHYDAPSDSDYKHGVDLSGEDVSIRIYTKTREDLTKLVNAMLILINVKTKEEQND